MEIKLYHYVHCPFCVRVRFCLSYLNIPHTSIVLAYEDEVTPLQLTGKKMLPIVTINGQAMNESLDIVEALDTNNQLKLRKIKGSDGFKDLEKKLTVAGEFIHSLTMPYWIYTPEFSASSRKYFEDKKSLKRGPFKDLIKNREEFETRLAPYLVDFEAQLNPFYQSEQVTILDIMLASHLWGLYVVPEFQFSTKMHNYLKMVKQITNFNYHEDFWK
jgi:glutaredoxin 2